MALPEPEPEPELHWEDAAAAAKAARMEQLAAQLDNIRARGDHEAHPDVIKAAQQARLAKIRSGEVDPAAIAEVTKDAQHCTNCFQRCFDCFRQLWGRRVDREKARPSARSFY